VAGITAHFQRAAAAHTMASLATLYPGCPPVIPSRRLHFIVDVVGFTDRRVYVYGQAPRESNSRHVTLHDILLTGQTVYM
jgi:hypothetical protein